MGNKWSSFRLKYHINGVRMKTRSEQLECKDNFESNGKLYLVRCVECGLENHSMVVSSGTCAWCEF